MLKACSICGKIHPAGYTHRKYRKYETAEERKLRSSNKWKIKSLEIRENADYLCEVCRDLGVITYDDLEVHHIEKIRDNKDLLLENNNLICLCVTHHKQADRGELSKEYLQKLAEDRERRKSP